MAENTHAADNVEAPGDLAKALREDRAAAASWETISIQHRRAHVTEIAEEKDPDVRARLVKEIVEHLSEE
jgi:uncharacterized protein YdeI (YjbR/CyaY-like superfamily)